jgi:hypothetical protein
MIPLYRLRMRMRKHYPGEMSKYLYARVPDDTHSYILRRAADEGVSMAEVIRRLVEAAQRVTLTSINPPGNNSEMISDNGGLSS